MVIIHKVFEDLSIVIHDSHNHNLCDRSIIIVKEGIFKCHNIIADEIIFMDNEEDCLGCCPDIPVEEQGTLEVSYPPNVIRGDRLVLSVLGAYEVRGNDEEAGGN